MLKQTETQIQQVVEIPLGSIFSNPHQPRRAFDDQSLEQLSASIAENGLLQPVTVRRMGNLYELISGERRVRACQRLEFETIPAIVVQVDDAQSAVFALLENIQRADLNFFEEAAAMVHLLHITGMRQEQLAVKLGKAPSTVANKLRLCSLPEEIQKMLLTYGMTERHARALLKLSHLPLQLEKTARHICKNSLTVAQTEQYIERLLKPVQQKQTILLKLQDTRLFMNTIRQAISTMKLAGVDISTDMAEDEQYLFYTMRIPKTPNRRPTATL